MSIGLPLRLALEVGRSQLGKGRVQSLDCCLIDGSGVVRVGLRAQVVPLLPEDSVVRASTLSTRVGIERCWLAEDERAASGIVRLSTAAELCR